MNDHLKSPPHAAAGPLSMRQGRTLAGLPRTRQYFDWGHVSWLVEPKDNEGGRISVGEVTFYPLCGEPDHSHFGEEQVLYVLSGSGVQSINGETTSLRQGDTAHIPPYSTHALSNSSETEDLKMLAFYSTARFRPPLVSPAEAPIEPKRNIDLGAFIDLGLTEKLLNQLSQALKLSLRLLDASGNSLVVSSGLPGLCREKGEGEHCRLHIQAAINKERDSRTPYFSSCCGGVSCLIIPVISGQEICGYIKCGEFFIIPDDRLEMKKKLANEEGLADDRIEALLAGIIIEKKSRLHSAAESTMAMASYTAESGMAMMRQKELDEKRLAIINEQMISANLGKALREADFKLLQSQINPHFLFNTLNIISQMAYMEGAEQAANLVCSLAELMRATLRKANKLIPLHEEIALLNDYLHIQKTRFSDKLSFEVKVEKELEEFKIPILILQPLVENSIVHGLEGHKSGCRIKVDVKKCGQGRVSLCVADNGPGFRPDQAAESAGTGLKSIRARLNHFFGDRFSMNIDSNPGEGCAITIIIEGNI